MNERIKELEIQCWEPRQYGPAWFNSTKFAQLIVRECIWLFGETRTEPSLERFILRRLGIDNENV